MGSLYSIGHGRRPIEAFVDLLKRYGVDHLVDVRSMPQSRFNPQYNRKALEESCQRSGIRYLFMGDELGGRPKDPAYLSNGKPDYEKMAGADFFIRGIERLENAYDRKISAALLCSESKPQECHRSHLIGKALLEKGILLQHIDENGALKTQLELPANGPPSGQGNLFDE